MVAEMYKTLTIQKCLEELSYTNYDYLLLSSYCDNQTLYTPKGFVIFAILNHILMKDSVITERIRKYMDIDKLFLDKYFKCKFQKSDVVTKILEEILKTNLNKDLSLDDFLSGDILADDMKMIIDSLDEKPMYPFYYIIDKSSNVELYSLDAFDILHVLMLLDSCFYAIDEKLEIDNCSPIKLIKEIMYYHNSECECNYNHTRWLFDIVSSNVSFEKVNREHHSIIYDEYSFFQKLLMILSDNTRKEHLVETLFVLYEANKGAHFLDALYNNFHSLPPDSLNPYLYGRMFPSFCVNEKGNEPMHYGSFPRSYIQEYEYPRIVSSWKDTFQSILGKTKIISFERIIQLLSSLNSFSLIQDCLIPSQFIRPVILVDGYMERRNRLHEVKNYYSFIETQVAPNYKDEYSDCVIGFNENSKWRSNVNYDKYPYEKNPFLIFVGNKTERDSTEKESTECFLSFFTWKASEIEKIIKRVCRAEHEMQIQNKQAVLDTLSLKERAIMTLYEADSSLVEMILSVFPWKEKRDDYMIYRDAVKDDEIHVVNRFSPDDWEERFNIFCGISCGKKALAKSLDYPDLNYFKTDCIGGKQYQCRKRFLKIIENNIPISRANIKQ